MLNIIEDLLGGQISQTALYPLIMFLGSLISPAELSEDAKFKLYEGTMNSIVASLRASGQRASYDEIKINKSSDSIDTSNFKVSIPISYFNDNDEICVANNQDEFKQFPSSKDQIEACFINLSIKSISLKNLSLKKPTEKNLIFEMSGIEFDLNAITNIQSENAAGINLVLGVITENNKINADYYAESGYNFNSDTSTANTKIKINNLINFEYEATGSNTTFKGDFGTFDLNQFKFVIEDLGARKLAEYFTLTTLGTKFSSELVSSFEPKNDSQKNKLEEVKKFLDGANKIECKRENSIYIDTEVLINNFLMFDFLFLLDQLCEELKSS